MLTRKTPLVEEEVYHIFNKSIADFKIFNTDSDFLRMKRVITYYQKEKASVSFSNFIRTKNNFLLQHDKEKRVDIIAYCIMPTHIHLILKQLKKNGISSFMSDILNSYARYFNIKYKRKGPLWEGRFKNILVESDEQLLHLTRYLHLNPTTAYLVDHPEDWTASSFREYLTLLAEKDRICHFKHILDIQPDSYKIFVEDRISYQRNLAEIKNLLMDPIPTYEVGIGLKKD